MSRERTSSKTWAERKTFSTPSPTSPVSSKSFTEDMEPTSGHDDAEWKVIQKNVFTRWCNERLKVVKIEVTNLPDDFLDGVKLINLVQVLSKKMVGRYNKKPRIYAQKMENVDVALNFLTKVEKIRIVNIGSGDIVNGNLKLVLGLIWTLILNYQISVGFGIDEKKKGSVSAKQVLMEFVQDFVPHRKVMNFTTEWNDGTMIAALVDGTAPGLCPEAYTMTPETPLENATHAMTLAQDWLGVPMVLHPEDIVNPQVDSLSVITYLSQFPEAKLKEGAPIKEGGDPMKVKAYGEGLKSEGISTSSHPVEFYVDVSEAKPHGSFKVNIIGPNNMEVRPDVSFKNDVYTCRYIPGEEGNYIIKIFWWGKPIANSPFTVTASASKRGSLPRQSFLSSQEQIKVYGPGVEGKDLRAAEPAVFWIEGVPSNMTVQAKITGPKGQLGSNYVKVEGRGKGKYIVFYYPMIVGKYTISLIAGGKDIGASPYSVEVMEAAKQVIGWAKGPGVEGIDIVAGKSTWFYVFTPTGLAKDISVSIEGPKGKVTTSQEKLIESVFKYTYIPKQNGEYKIIINIGPKGKTITLHFMIIVPSSASAGMCKVWGTGVSPRGIQSQQSVQVHVQPMKPSETSSENEDIVLSVSSDDGEIPVTKEVANGVCTFTYKPTKVGKYTISVIYQKNPLPNSPFVVNVTDASKVSVSGQGVDGAAIPVHKKVKLAVDATKAGKGDLQCEVQPLKGSKYSMAPKVNDKNDGTFEVTLSPAQVCQEELSFTYDDIPLAQKPVTLNVVDISKVKVSGRGIQQGNTVDKPTFFMIDASEAGDGTVEANITPKPKALEVAQCTDEKPGVYKCQYIPTVAGDYSANITFSGLPTEGSPYDFKVAPVGEVSAVTAYGPALESGLTVGTPAEFFIDASKEAVKDIDINVESPAGEVEVKKEPLENDVMKCTFPVYEPGPYSIDVTADGKALAGLPTQTESTFPVNSPKVTVSGKGIEEAIVDQWAEFDIDYHREGSGALNVLVNGPAAAKTEITAGPTEGTAHVRYLPTKCGEYMIQVQFDGKQIPGSRFAVKAVSKDGAIDEAAESEVVQLLATGVKLGTDFQYKLDTSNSQVSDIPVIGKVIGPFKKGQIPEKVLSKSVTISSFPSVTAGYPEIESTVTEDNKVYSVQFTPEKIGVYVVYIFYGNNMVDNMPYTVNVCDPSKIAIKGKGLGQSGGEKETCLVDNPITWDVDCSEAGPGDLKAYIAGPDNCPKDFDIEELPNDKYKVTYNPTEPGSYQVLYAYSGFDLADKPTLMISDPSKAQVKDTGMKLCTVGEKVTFPVDLSTAGAGRLQANLEGPAEVPIEFDKNDDGTCTFSFVPTEVGTYTLNISFGDKPLSDEPMSVTAVDYDKVKVYGSGVTGLGTQVNQTATVAVDCTECGVAPLTASLKTTDGKILPLEFHPVDEGVFEAEYRPDTVGNYELSLDFAGKPVKESPFNVPIANPSEVVLAQPGKALQAAPGETCQLEVFTESAGPGVLTAYLQSTDESFEPVEAVVKPLDETGNGYLIDFPIPKEGHHQAVVCYNDIPICDPIDVIGGTPPDCKVEGPGIKPKVALERGTSFTVDTTNCSPGTLEAVISAPNDTTLPLEVTQEGPIYEVRYVPEVVGDYSIDLKFDNIPLADSPYKTTCVDTAPLELKPVFEGASIKIGQPVEFIADLGSIPDGQYEVMIEGPEECQIVSKEEPDGTRSYSFTPKSPGVYSIIGTYDELPVAEVPTSVIVTDKDQASVSGPGVTSPQLGKPAEVIVNTKDSGPGKIEGVLTTPTGEALPIEFKPDDENPDLQVATYTPVAPGKYALDITFDGEPIAESPFTAAVLDKDQIKVDGDGITDAGIGLENVFDLFMPMVKPEEVTLQLITEDEQEIPINFTVDEISEDQCQVKYVPEEVGVFAAKLCYAGNPIMEPMPITIGDPEKVKISGPAVEEGTKFPAKQETHLLVDTSETKANKVKVDVKPSNMAVDEDVDIAEEIVITTDDQGVFKAAFTPTVAGEHDLVIKCCGKAHHYPLNVFDPTSVKCTPEGPVAKYKLGEPVVLEYDISKAGNGNFNMSITGPENCDDVQSKLEDGLVTFTLNPTTPGLYKVEATMEDMPCKEEPLKVIVLDLDKVEISGAGVTGKNARIGMPVEVIVDMSKSGPVDMEATLQTPTGEKLALDLAPKADEPMKLLGAYTPTMGGYHVVNFTVDEEPFLGEPMRAYVVNPEEFKIEETEGPLEAVPGQLNVLNLFMENNLEDQDLFSVLIEDEDGQEKMIDCQVSQTDSQHWKLEYVPEIDTAQYVMICYNEVPITEKIPIAQVKLSECFIEGIQEVVAVNEETSFKIDVSAVKKSNFSIVIKQSDNSEIEASIIETGEGVYQISYTPTVMGALKLIIKYGGALFGDVPAIIAIDPTLVTCTGLDNTEVLINETIVFAVDTSAAGSGAELKVQMEGPEGSTVLCQAMDNEGHFSGTVSSSQPGACRLYITYGGLAIAGCPFTCGFKRPEPDATKCSVSDIETPGKFSIDCRDAGGNGVLEVAVYGAYVPARYIAVEHNGDYTFSVSYDIPDPVETVISVKWHGEHLQGSPFKVIFKK